MFSLFRKKKANIHSISIPDFGWAKSKNESSIIQWINPEQTIAISTYFFDMPPDLPPAKDLDQLRAFFRARVSDIHGGLVEVDLLQKHIFTFAKIIFKLPQTPTGITYIASITIPFKTCSFVLKVQATETYVTGQREAIIANQLIAEGTLQINQDGYVGWANDPYDVHFKSGLLMNKAESKIYDVKFPDHPLTQIRQLISKIEQNFKWCSELEKLQAFYKKKNVLQNPHNTFS